MLGLILLGILILFLGSLGVSPAGKVTIKAIHVWIGYTMALMSHVVDAAYGGHRKSNELHSSRQCARDKSRRSRPWLSKRREPQAQAAERRALEAHPPVIGVENVLNEG